MGATFNTGYLENLILYNGSNNIGIGTSADATYKVTLGGSLLGTSANFTGAVTSAGLTVTGTNNDFYVGATFANTINFGYNTNTLLGGWVNYTGYLGGTTQFRDFNIGNGKNGVVAFFQGSTGNVGINTNNPESVASSINLQIDGASHSFVRTGTSTYGGYFSTIPTADVLVISNVRNPVTGTYSNTGKASSSIQLFSASGNGYIVFNTTATNNSTPSPRMTITSGGSVLINTSTDSGRLSVQSGGISSYPIYWRNSAGTYGGGVYNTGSGNMQLYLCNSSGTENVLIAASGTSFFNGGSVSMNSGSLQISNGNQTANTTCSLIELGNRGYFGTANIGAAKIEAISTGANWYSGTALSFSTNPGPDVTSTSAVERMRITSGGNVLMYNQVEFWDNSGGNVKGAIQAFGDDFSNGNLRFYSKGSGTLSERMRIASNGDITLGITPSYDSAIIWRYSFNGGITGRIWSDGNPRLSIRCDESGGVFLSSGGVGWNPITSDERKKKNFETTQGLSEILKIEPVKYHFDWDDDFMPKRLGFKAQNILSLIPEMVLPNGDKWIDGSDILTITPDYILPVLVKAIQEQQQQIEELKALINK